MTASKKPIHDAKEKTPGNKGSKGEKAKIKAMERTRVALAGFLDVNLFPETSTTSTCLVCAVQTTSECANQPVNVVDDHL